jgi:hypothetical protein
MCAGGVAAGLVTASRWRVGRKVGRTIYRQIGDKPGDLDQLVGLMDTPALAAMVVAALNQRDARAGSTP